VRANLEQERRVNIRDKKITRRSRGESLPGAGAGKEDEHRENGKEQG
jgi:hypothetical protein